MDHQNTLIKAFTDMAPRYEQKVDGELQRFWGWSYQGFVNQLLETITPKPDDRILDVATGTSVIPRELRKHGKQAGKIFGLDLTLAMLQQGKELVKNQCSYVPIHLACGSALEMPLSSNQFDIVTCGLATHHMDIPVLLSELKRVLKLGGSIVIADVGAANAWRNWLVGGLLRAGAFAYFLPKEGTSRALAEAEALSHIYTPEEWKLALASAGFDEIQITTLSTNHFWSPVPLIIQATKR